VMGSGIKVAVIIKDRPEVQIETFHSTRMGNQPGGREPG
jgi:hypothetical protein